MTISKKSLPAFLKASGTGIGVREQFLPEQILALHQVHAYLQNEGALSDLSFEYRHHLCRASFTLTGGEEGTPAVSVRLSERCVSERHWQYTIDTVVDDVLSQSTDFMCNLPARIMDDAFLEMLAARVKAESVKMYQCEPDVPALEFKALLLRMGQQPL